MRTRLLTLFILCLIYAIGFSQDSTKTKKNRFPIWTFHEKNTNVYGLSTGIATIRSSTKNVNTFGIKLEAIGVGIFFALAPNSPIAQSKKDFNDLILEPFSERIYGLSISPLGSACDCTSNGLTISGYGQYYGKNNGISIAGMINFVQEVNGLQLAIFMNETFRINGIQGAAYNIAKESNGIQIGIFNKTDELKGIQLGLWNVNNKRKLPLFNWNFKRE